MTKQTLSYFSLAQGESRWEESEKVLLEVARFTTRLAISVVLVVFLVVEESLRKLNEFATRERITSDKKDPLGPKN